MPAEPADRLEGLLDRVLDACDVDGEITVEEDEETLRANIEGDDLGLLIGRHGQTIDALEHLGARIAFHGEGARKRVVVDAAGYRERRADILERQADRAVEEAVQYGRPVALDAMVASERRVVHEYLRDRRDVETYSEGEDPDRHLVIAPVVAD
jgi:spoIIIJ-associated protein